jgi:hypothetical protein
MGEGNENLVYPSPWDFKRSLTRRKILRHGIFGFTSHSNKDVLRIFIEIVTFGSSDKHTNHYTTKATCGVVLVPNVMKQHSL